MKKILLALMLLCSNAFGAITDGKFGINQIFDVQYWWNGNTLNASSFIAPYDKNWNHPTLSTGQYFKFFASTVSPGEWGLGIYNADGTRASIVHDYGTIDALGNGAIFYIGSGFFGNVISTSQGYSYGASATFTNMNTSPTTSDYNSYTWASSTPLAAGQTAAPAAPVVSMKPIYTGSANLYTTNIVPTSYNSPSNEGAAKAFDNNPNTKYLNFDKYSAGVTIKLNSGRVVSGFKLTTANDFSGRDPTSYKLYASNDGRNWDKLGEGTLTLSDSRYTVSDMITVANTQPYFYYFIYFPTTKAGQGCGQNCNSMQIGDITYYYDENNTVSSIDTTPAGGSILNPGTPGATAAGMEPEWPATSDITVNQLSLSNAARNRRNAMGLGNRVDLDTNGSGNAVTIEQVGNYNRVQGIGGGYAYVGGFGTAVNIKQGDTLSGRNLIELSTQGNGNNITIDQARDTTTGSRDAVESGGHITMLSVSGDINTIMLRQGNDGGSVSGHFMYVGVQGNYNNGTVKQSNNGEKQAFVSVTGNQDVFNVLQSGTGNHYIDLALTGNNNQANITQKDAGSHKATINLTNAGGASNVTLVQQGATAQNINITQQCATLSGCSVSVTQGQ